MNFLESKFLSLIKNGNNPPEKILEVAELWVKNRLLKYRGDKERLLQTFSDIVREICRLKNAQYGIDRKVRITAVFIGIISEKTGSLLLECPRGLEFLAVRAQQLGRADFIGGYLNTLWSEMKGVIGVIEYFEQLALPDPILDSFEKSRLQTVSKHTFDELCTLRKYGIKPCAFAEGTVAQKGHYWLYAPSDIEHSLFNEEENIKPLIKDIMTLHGQLLQENSIAAIHIGSERKLRVKTKLFDEEEYDITNPHAMSYNSLGTFSIGYDGELYHRLASLKEIFAKRGKSTLYELVKNHAIFRLYDLIVPLTIQRKAPSFPVPRNILVFTQKTDYDPTLYLQRVRVMEENLSQLEGEAEKEFVEALNKHTPTTHQLPEQNVVYHIRKLPSGYKASEKAKQLATTIMKYQLQPGETFVSASTRNKGNPKSDVIHQGKKRRTK